MARQKLFTHKPRPHVIEFVGGNARRKIEAAAAVLVADDANHALLAISPPSETTAAQTAGAGNNTDTNTALPLPASQEEVHPLVADMRAHQAGDLSLPDVLSSLERHSEALQTVFIAESRKSGVLDLEDVDPVSNPEAYADALQYAPAPTPLERISLAINDFIAGHAVLEELKNIDSLPPPPILEPREETRSPGGLIL